MLSRFAVVLLVAVTTVTAQCSALCLLFPHEPAQHRQPVDASQSEGCHRHGSQAPDQQNNDTPCGHQLCVEEGPQITLPTFDSGPVFPVISAAVSVAPEQVVRVVLVEDPSPPPPVNLAAKAILRI